MSTKKANVIHSESVFSAADGYQLREQSWLPDADPKAIVAIIHGYAEHSDRYAHVADYLAAAGYGVLSFDLRGHGKSDGKNTHVGSFDEYLADVDIFLTRIRQSFPGKKLFLLGHSMGGAIASLYVITRQPDLAGLLLSGALVKISDDISPLLVKLSGFIGKILPKLPTIKLDSKAISSDPDVVRRYETDPLIYRGGIPARTGAEMNRAATRIQSDMEAIKLPVLIMHGTADRLSDPAGSQQLHDRVASTDKTLKLYPEFFHEIMNEPEKKQVLADIAAWLKQH